MATTSGLLSIRTDAQMLPRMLLGIVGILVSSASSHLYFAEHPGGVLHFA